MTYHGSIRNGAVVLDEPVMLAEGVKVEIRVLAEAESASADPIARARGALRGKGFTTRRFIELKREETRLEP